MLNKLTQLGAEHINDASELVGGSPASIVMSGKRPGSWGIGKGANQATFNDVVHTRGFDSTEWMYANEGKLSDLGFSDPAFSSTSLFEKIDSFMSRPEDVSALEQSLAAHAKAKGFEGFSFRREQRNVEGEGGEEGRKYWPGYKLNVVDVYLRRKPFTWDDSVRAQKP